MTSQAHLVLFCSLAIFVSRGHAQGGGQPRTGACTTPNGKPGHCLPVGKCMPVLNILKAPPFSPEAKRFLREVQCRVNGRSPIVCCADDKLNFPDARNPWVVAPPSEETNQAQPNEPLLRSPQEHPNLGLLPVDDCGLDFTEKIIGGTETGLDEFPWTALLQYQTLGDSGKNWWCGGVLISNRYVLTAAHCISKVDLGSDSQLIGVRLGEYNIASEEDCEEISTNERYCADPPLDFGVEKEIIHPGYVAKSDDLSNDIALIRLNASVIASEFIKPICIPIEPEVRSKTYLGTDLTVVGWGRTQRKSSSAVKLKVNVPVVENDVCQRVLKRQLSSKQLCAGGEEGKDSCRGDSGGPLMSADKLRSDGILHYHVTGIVSYGPSPCGIKGQPGVYTRVAEYSGWILDQLEP